MSEKCPKCGADLLQCDDYINEQYIEMYWCPHCGYREGIIE